MSLMVSLGFLAIFQQIPVIYYYVLIRWRNKIKIKNYLIFANGLIKFKVPTMQLLKTF